MAKISIPTRAIPTFTAKITIIRDNRQVFHAWDLKLSQTDLKLAVHLERIDRAAEVKTLLLTFLTIFSLFSAVSTADSGLGYPNRYSSIAESLFDMMDAFASAFQKKKSEHNDYYNHAPIYQPGFVPGTPHPPLITPYTTPYGRPYGGPSYGQDALISRLNGQWQSNTGEVLVIRQARFRIYQGRDNFHEGLISILNGHTLIIQDYLSGASRQYEYAEKDGRLALRDEFGNLLLFFKLGY